MTKTAHTFDTPFDTYTASGIIGQGGAGRVYVVSNTAGEEFALKCLTPERITSERLKRFKNEIQFCQRCNHSNIVKVVDTGSTLIRGVKCPFYVMRRYSGTLRTQMGKMKPDDVMMLFSQILDGVEAAHFTKVWHRDLKPENILYEQRENLVSIADFGIAHFEEEEIYTAIETKATDRLANFQYSAPEQRVRNSEVDHRADIFALGLILNELFTGEVLQGAGHKRIAEFTTEHGYLDDLVELMTQQNPMNRPESIEKIKEELIGRRSAFVALQKYDELKKKVVHATEVSQFDPIRIVDFDYQPGVLTLMLSADVPYLWILDFQSPPGGCRAIMGYEPEIFKFNGDTASIRVHGGDERYIQSIVDHAKDYVNAANQGYVERMREKAKEEDRKRRETLQREIAEAEMRKNILSSVKL